MDFLKRYFAGQLSPQEESQVQDWLVEHSEDPQVQEALEAIMEEMETGDMEVSSAAYKKVSVRLGLERKCMAFVKDVPLQLGTAGEAGTGQIHQIAYLKLLHIGVGQGRAQFISCHVIFLQTNRGPSKRQSDHLPGHGWWRAVPPYSWSWWRRRYRRCGCRRTRC